jgi:uncharacterized protein
MKIRIAGAYILLSGCLLAQTSQSSPETPSKPKTEPSAASVDSQKLDAAKEADIRKLMDLVGTSALVLQMMQEMGQNLKPLLASSLPPGDYREKLIDLFFVKFHSKANAQQILNLAIPAYGKYFSAQEIKDLIKFYESPLGQKIASVLPKMTAELQEAGSKWGENLGRDCMQEVLSENPDLKKAIETAAKGRQPKQ